MKKLRKQLKREIKSVESQIRRLTYISILGMIAVAVAASTCTAASIV